MAKNTLRDLYIEQLEDIYSAESQLIDALPRIILKAKDKDLRETFQNHLDETKGQVDRVAGIMSKYAGAVPGSHTCHAMKGLIKESEEALNEVGNSTVIDAHLIAAAHRIEHYEIAAYESARSMAKALDENIDADILKENLKEEQDAASELTKLADGGIFSRGLHEEAVA